MNLSSWMILVFLLSAGTSLAAVNVKWLTGVVGAIRDKYKIDGQFCLAANIPRNIKSNNLDQVLDPYSETFEDTVNGLAVYQGSNVVAAKCAEPVHAEHAVLNHQNLQNLMFDSKDHFLLIYSYLSPCGNKCANPNDKNNIIKQIRNNVLPKWKDSAFVFDTVFDKPKHGPRPTKKDLREALKQLGNSGLRLQNIFRCYEPKTQNKKKLQCYSCLSRTGDSEVSDVCVEQEGGSSQETEQIGREGSSSGGGATNSNRDRPGSQEPSSSRRSQSRGRSSRRSNRRNNRRSSSSRSSSPSNRRNNRRSSSSRSSSPSNRRNNRRNNSRSNRRSYSRSNRRSYSRSSSPNSRRSRDRQRNSRSSSRKSKRFHGPM